MGYGFDLDEWVSSSQLTAWHDYLQGRLGWKHFLGGRPAGPNAGTNHSAYQSWNASLDYSSYEHHRPTYDVYVAALELLPEQPVFSEDRFRIRDEGRAKDYSAEETRRGLWISTMAGGVANIWGNLLGSPHGYSLPYPNKNHIRTYTTFFQDRFLKGMRRCNDLTDGYCLGDPVGERYIFYREDASSIRLNLSWLAEPLPAVAIDAKDVYEEIDLGLLGPADQTWNAPHTSDWAVAVGVFPDEDPRPTFGDVPADHWAHPDIEALFQGGFVTGCSLAPRLYCPQDPMTRAEGAVFIERGLHGADFIPIPPSKPVFADVPLDEWFAKWAQALWGDGYTAGCSTEPLLFCPLRGHTRAESTVFFLRMLHGADYIPPTPTTSLPYDDVSSDRWYFRWVAAAHQEELIQDCEDPENRADQLFRPEEYLTRAEGACMMVRAKGLTPP
jgi:hypothetical protein